MPNDLKKMAISAIKPGTPPPMDDPEAGYDYSHVLPDEHRAAGYRISVNNEDGEWIAKLYHNGQHVGQVDANHMGNSLHIGLAVVAGAHRGKGLGTNLYEALMAHGKHALGVKYVAGMQHSSLAHKAHQRLAQKHGMDYKALPNVGNKKYPTMEAWQSAPNEDYDSKWGPYSYELKGEKEPNLQKGEDLRKMAISDLKPGTQSSWSKEHYDYSHLLPQELRDAGYDLSLRDTGTYLTASINMGPYGVGVASALRFKNDGPIHIQQTEVHPKHRKKGLGTAMYEALLTHAKHIWGVTEVAGSAHSTSASKTHQRISAKHGMDYEAKPNIGGSSPYKTQEEWNKKQPTQYDQKFARYRYTIKEEMRMEKSEGNLSDGDIEGARRMMRSLDSSRYFEAARFLTGKQPITANEVRRSFVRYEGDAEAAALDAYGLPVTDEMRRAIRAIAEGQSLSKSEVPEGNNANRVVLAATPYSVKVASALQYAYMSGMHGHIKLDGKHTKNAEVARDPHTNVTYLIKYQSGDVSPAAGVDEEFATGPRREAAFFRVAEILGVAHFYPETRLVLIDGYDAAAIKVLTDVESMEEIRAKDPNKVLTLLEPYRNSGQLHQWAALDYLLGNPDRHAGNILVKDKRVFLIDHGSAFAGRSFDPANDENSFIPFYLRAWGYRGFLDATPEERLRRMPRISQHAEEVLKAWVDSIDPQRLAATLREFGLDPAPVIERLASLKAARVKHDFLNRKFAGG